MELYRREVFATVATELRFGGAAGKPHVGQPALSGLSCSMERDGTRVLFRITRQVKLTNAGSELLAHAKVDVIAWNGTSASWLGFDRDERLCGRDRKSVV